MTIEQFLRRLARTPRRWRLSEGVCLRDDLDRCPIQAVAGGRRMHPDLSAARRMLRLPIGLTGDIVCAADGEQPELRARLLRACGLFCLGTSAQQKEAG